MKKKRKINIHIENQNVEDIRTTKIKYICLPPNNVKAKDKLYRENITFNDKVNEKKALQVTVIDSTILDQKTEFYTEIKQQNNSSVNDNSKTYHPNHP